MRYEIWLLILLLGVFFSSALFHRAHLKRADNKLRNTAGCSYDLDLLKKALQINQGSNFNTIMLSIWSLFFVSFSLLYFLTPTIFPRWNYFRLALFASSWWGLILFGMAVAAIIGAFASFMPRFSLPWIYQYYVISRTIKIVMAHWIPILLLICISLSFYLATIYPDVNYSAWNIAYAALFGSLILLMLPIISGSMEDKI
jgi:hypothetical protein